MTTGNKREVTWCFVPSQPERLYQGEYREMSLKCFKENRAIWKGKKNATTNTWVEEDLSKFPETRRH